MHLDSLAGIVSGRDEGELSLAIYAYQQQHSNIAIYVLLAYARTAAKRVLSSCESQILEHISAGILIIP